MVDVTKVGYEIIEGFLDGDVELQGSSRIHEVVGK